MILDGAGLARERAAGLAARAEAVTALRRRRPRLVLVAFAGADGVAPFVTRKIRACEGAGVDVLPLILPGHATTTDARQALGASLRGEPCDGVFLQFPFPAPVDGDAVTAVIPSAADVDVMTDDRIRRFMSDRDEPPPVTVSAGLALLDRYEVDVTDLTGVVVAEPSPFALMFREALARRGARMQPLVPADAPDLKQRTADAQLVVAAAARPGIVRSADLAPATVAIDVGYFNATGRGDIDTSGGIDHLAAIARVPGGIGPMTVSALVERVIAFAERSAGID